MNGLYDEIQANNATFMKCWASGDFKSLSQVYTEDCKLMPTGCDTQIGKQAVCAVFSSVFEHGSVKVVLKSGEVGPMDGKDIAFEDGHYTFYDKDDKVVDHGKYVVIWKRVGGKLHMYIDIFNSNKA